MVITRIFRDRRVDEARQLARKQALQEGREEGLQEGRQEGRRQGRQEGRQEERELAIRADRERLPNESLMDAMERLRES